MHRHIPVNLDEVEDELELHNEAFRKQIADGYQAYLRGETRNVETVIAELRQLTWRALSRAEG